MDTFIVILTNPKP